MKLIVEIEFDNSVVKLKPIDSEEQKKKVIKFLDRKICSKINDILLDESLNHNDYIAEIGDKRWIDVIEGLTAIDIVN